MKKLFFIDAMALIYRAHFAFIKNPRITSKGLNTSAVFGFINTLMEILEKEKPSHLAVAFDTFAPTFRHEQYDGYKAQRQETPEDIVVATPLIKQILKGMNIASLELDGYEADDIVGTFAKKAARDGFTVYMLTSDKDYAQLVEENIFLYRPSFLGKGYDVLGIPEVLKKFGIKEVHQVIDILGLMGDAVDNIPGIPGIGEKTAQKLIDEYGSVENLIANADKLKGKQQENVINFAQQGLLSKHLATINTDVPLPYNIQELEVGKADKELLTPLFTELEFKTLARRILGEEQTGPLQVSPSKSGQLSLFGAVTHEGSAIRTESTSNQAPEELQFRKSIETVPHQYHIVKEDADLKSLAHYLSLQKEFTFDTETDSLESSFTNIVGLSFAYIPQEAYFIPFPPDFEKAKAILHIFKEVLESENIIKIGQNLKFDINVLARYGIEVKGAIFDTMLAHYLLYPDQRHGMDQMSESYLNYTPVSIETLIGKKGKAQGTMADVPLHDLAEYAAEDSDITLQLKKALEPEIHQNGQQSLLMDVEGKLIYVLSDMERSGVKIDTSVLSELSKDLADQIVEIEKEVYQSAGEPFNLSSPQQLGKILFEKLKLDPKAKKTKTGQWATGEEILSRMADEHPIVSQILEFREMQKLKSTYIDALPQLIAEDGRVHTSFNQAVAATGRLSSTNPNLQNIPIRTARGREIRKAFVAGDSDRSIVSVDYSQIELRIMAHFADDATMIEAFRQGKDIHTITASKIYKVPVEQVDGDMRRKAKTANFGIIYGISAFGLSQRLRIPRKEAADLIDAYFEEFSAIKRYMDSVVSMAREQGFVSTLLGRRRYLSDINSHNITQRGFAERNAINAPIQGSAADLIKLAMIDVHQWMKKENLKSRMVLQVHDELVFDAHTSELDLLKEMVPKLMSGAMPMKVPVEVGLGVGANWFEAH